MSELCKAISPIAAGLIALQQRYNWDAKAHEEMQPLLRSGGEDKETAAVPGLRKTRTGVAAGWGWGGEEQQWWKMCWNPYDIFICHSDSGILLDSKAAVIRVSALLSRSAPLWLMLKLRQLCPDHDREVTQDLHCNKLKTFKCFQSKPVRQLNVSWLKMEKKTFHLV